MGFGTSIVFPSWYASHHGVSLGTASSILAVANLSMIAGGVLTAFLLGRGVRALRLFSGLAACGLLASIALFTPGLPTMVCLAALGLWLVSSGASTAVVTSSLPRVVADPSQGAAAAGLLSQVAALTTFITPQIWLPVMATGQWGWFIVIVALSWAAALALFPVRGRSGSSSRRLACSSSRRALSRRGYRRSSADKVSLITCEMIRRAFFLSSAGTTYHAASVVLVADRH